jgi:hypothetical protein
MTDFNPGFQSEGSYSPDRLIAGDHPVRTIGVTIATGQNLQRGALLGTDGSVYRLSEAAAADGSETPVAILGEDVDATGGAAQSFAYVAGDFNANAMTFGAGHTADGVRSALQARSMYLHTAIPA